MELRANRPLAAGALAALLSILLAACILSPGKFTSALDVRKDRSFRFSYTGEMFLLPFAKPADKPKVFAAQPCHDEDGFTERTCLPEEIAQQKRQWKEDQAQSAAREKRDSDSARMFLGGLDPGDPRAAEELAERLRKQAGWRKVVYKGQGLYDVDFAIAGTLDRDFVFPTLERFPMANAFVQISMRQDGSIRIDAPGFGPAGSGSPMQGLMMGAALSDGGGGGGDQPPFPAVDGTFTLRTDAQVLANNTDDGPQADPVGTRMDWTVTARSTAAPMALLRAQR